MRLTRIALAAMSLAVLAGCNDDEVSSPTRPPLAGVRVINAIADTGSVDVVMVDQVDWSLMSARNINFRAGSIYEPVEAKARHIRVFTFNSASPTINNVTQVLHDTTITFAADSKQTLLLTGSARAKTVKFIVINDGAAPTPAAGQIAVRAVNASTGAIDAYLLTTATDPIAGAPAAANLGSFGTSTYVSRATGNVAARFTDAGTTTATASAAGPNAPPVVAGANPGAGVNSAGSVFSVYFFPRGVAGSPQNAVTTPTAVWFVDRVPVPTS